MHLELHLNIDIGEFIQKMMLDIGYNNISIIKAIRKSKIIYKMKAKKYLEFQRLKLELRN